MSDNAPGYRPPTKSKRERATSLPAALAPDSVAATGSPPATGRWFRVVECDLDAGGTLRVRPREYLSRSVYDRSTTFRFLVLEAKKLSDSQSIGVTDEQGRLAHLFAGKTGRFASKDAKKLVAAKLLVDGLGSDQPAPPEPRPKRTSRVPKAPTAQKRTSRKKRTSMLPVSAESASSKRTSRRPRKTKTPEPAVAPRSSIWNP